MGAGKKRGILPHSSFGYGKPLSRCHPSLRPTDGTFTFLASWKKNAPPVLRRRFAYLEAQ